MYHLDTILTVSLTIYALVMTVFLISENRRPQATLAWILVFIFAPVIGGWSTFFSAETGKPSANRAGSSDRISRRAPFLFCRRCLSRQDAEIARLEDEGGGHRKLMMLVRRNSHSALTGRNRVEIQQDAAEFYPSMIEGH